MPTYEYRCERCGQRMEIIHPIHGEPPAACPNCGAVGTLRKAFAPPAIVFKGSGWAKKERAAARSKAATSKDGEGEKKATGGDGKSTAEGTGSAPKAAETSSPKAAAADD
jgi:putative FmdB family regulatory protein